MAASPLLMCCLKIKNNGLWVKKAVKKNEKRNPALYNAGFS
jgi:hypothetical protein